jgi:hypothetical protein
MPKPALKQGSSASWVERNKKYNLTCTVDKVKPAGTIQLVINGTVIDPGINTTVTEYPDHDGTYILTKTVEYRYESLQHTINITCEFALIHGNTSIRLPETKMMLVYCKFMHSDVSKFVIPTDIKMIIYFSHVCFKIYGKS